MRSTRCILLITAILALSVCAANAVTTLATAGDGDGSAGRDWYSNPNYYWVDSTSASVGFSHDGGSRWSLRGAVIIDISSLAGATLAPNSASFNFYSLGIGGTSLQHLDGDPGAVVTTGFATTGGTQIASLELGEGWQSYDVTDLISGDIAAGRGHVAFIFNVVTNYSGGSIAASEDSQGRGAYLEVVPEPNSALSLAVGFPAALWRLRRRKRVA